MFSWIKWPNESRVPSRHSGALQKTSEAAASHKLIRELLFHVEQQERLREQKQSALGHSRFQKYPKLQTIFTTAELQQLEFLCAQIPPTHTAKVISRYLIATIQFYISWYDAVKSSLVHPHKRPDSRHKNREHPKGM